MYYQETAPDIAENEWSKPPQSESSSKIININADVFEFLERTVMTFDRVTIYRFLEHVSFTQVLYFIYLVSTVTTSGSVVDIIVPNYTTLANMILKEDVYNKSFEAQNILLTTELLNEPSCPHASIWTPERANYFWELEERFVVEEIESNFNFDGRDIYLRFKARRYMKGGDTIDAI
jgi:hypothetical protein